MRTKLVFKIILGLIFIIGDQYIKAQSCNAEFKIEIDGSVCANDGKAAVTVNVKANGSNIDLSNCSFVIWSTSGTVSIPAGQNSIRLAPGPEYTVRPVNLICNGQEFNSMSATFKIELKLTKAEYIRCSASDVLVSAAISGGKGPYKYQLFDNGTEIATGSSATSEISFSSPAPASFSSLELKVTDEGCPRNGSVLKRLEQKGDYSAVSTVIEGDKSVCENETVELSVKSQYSGSGYEWKKGNTLISSGRTLRIEHVTAANAGTYTFSMKLAGCESLFTETFDIAVGGPPVPNVQDAYICLNSNEVSLSQYAFTTSNAYTLVWYQSNGTLIGATAPRLNPNLPATVKYLVSQKNNSGCESPKAELTVIVEELPVKTGESNIIVCLSNDSKPKIRVVNAGNNIYNLYTAYRGGTKTGSGTAVNDTAIIETSQDLITGNDYYLETENVHGCVSYERTTVPVRIRESLILGPDKICFGDNLSLSADYAGGKIVWTKPDNSSFGGKILNINNVKFENAGVYSLLIEEPGLSCVMRDQIQVAVKQPAPPHVAVNSIRYHQNENAAPLAATPKPGMTLKWYGPEDTFIPGQQSPVPATGETGVFVYRVSQDSLGCESPKAEITVIVGTIPDAVPESDINICMADRPVVQIQNSALNFKYTVSYQNNVIAENDGNGGTISLTSSIPITEDGEFEITVSDIYGIKSPVTRKNVTVPASLIVESPSVFCLGSNFQLVAIDIENAGYKWISPSGNEYSGKSVSVTDAKAENSGIYTLTVTTSGCPAVEVKKRVNVTQPEPPALDKDSYRFYENENAAPLTATPKPGMTLKWYYPEETLLADQSPVPATDNTGVFVYYVSQDSLGCESPKRPVTVVVGEVPGAVPESDVNICMADKPVIQIKNTVSDYKYTVYYNNGMIAEGRGNGGTISLTSRVSISENTKLGVTVTDVHNVSSPQTKTDLISVNNLIDFGQSSSSVCDGSGGKLTAVSITGAAYMWTVPGGNTVEGKYVTISGANSGDAGIYTLSVTTPGCPVAQQTVELKVERPAKPSATKEVYYCTGDNATPLAATASNGYKTVWFNESHEQLPAAPVPNTSVAGVSVYYVLQMSVSDENCMSDKEMISVTVENKPGPMVLEPVHACYAPGDAVQVSVRIPVSSKGYIYSLYSQENGGAPAGQVSSPNDGVPVDITVNGSEIQSSKIYYLEIMNSAGCVSQRTPVEIILTEITLSPDELPPYQVEEFYSQRLETNVPGANYSIIQGYLPAGFTISSLGDISGIASSYADPAIFTVEITSSLGCSIQKEYMLKSELLVSKMFSPNGDGINEIFMKGYKVVIFDRLGRKLYSGEDGWDGTFNGRVMPEDVYFYILYYKDKDGKEQRITSYVTLIKTT